MKKLSKYDHPLHLAEIFQAVDVKFAFVKDEADDAFKEITMPGKCRDFLGDVLYSRVKGVPVQIWGFAYDYKKAPYDDDALKLSLKFPTPANLGWFKEHLGYIHEKETTAGVKQLTQVFDTDAENTLVVIADPAWQKSTWRLSLYTYYIKVASYKDENSLQVPESNYQQYLTKEREATLLSHVNDAEVAFAGSLGGNHDQSGFISTIKMNGPESQRIFGSK